MNKHRPTVDVPIESVRMSGFLPEVDGRNWVYPRLIDGRFQRLRKWVGAGLIAFLLILPWIRIQGLPAVLFDIPGRRFVLLGQVFFPQDVWLVLLVLLVFAMAVILFTALWGRVWCGYACPQSVFMNSVYLRVERWIEGEPAQQRKLDRAPWTWNKIWRKGLKHAIFLAAASLVAHIILAFFFDVRLLLRAILNPGPEYATPIVFATIVTVAMYIDFAFLREQFCNWLCPYARFQSALIDEESLIVTYDPARGEPRTRVGDRATASKHGDCIDCNWCVVVCPQGIDIRDGLQLECIHCAACIDACDEVMDRVGQPRGLIRYDSERRLEDPQARVRWWRPRVLAYTVVLTALAGLLAWQLAARPMVEVTLVRPPGDPLRLTAVGEPMNFFRLNLVHKKREPTRVRVELRTPGLRLVTPTPEFELAPTSVRRLELFVVAPRGYRGDGHFDVDVVDAATGLRRLAGAGGTLILPGEARHAE